MDHAEAVRLKATERYLLNELDPDQLDQFEEHLFDCPECTVDVRSAAMMIEQAKTVLAEPETQTVTVLKPVPVPWYARLRPAFAVPVFALLLAVIGYQNFVVYPGLKQAANSPYVVPAAAINIASRGATPAITAKTGEPFILLVNVPSESRFSSYIADLYDSSGKIQWSLPISAETANDTVPVRIPGQHAAGTYALAVRGIPQGNGTPAEIGRQPFELRLQ
jgi:hypothetical protein